MNGSAGLPRVKKERREALGSTKRYQSLEAVCAGLAVGPAVFIVEKALPKKISA